MKVWGVEERMQYDELVFSEKGDGEISMTLVAAEFADTPLPFHVFAECLQVWLESFIYGGKDDNILKWVYNVFSFCFSDTCFVWGMEVQFWPGPKRAVGNTLNNATKIKVMPGVVEVMVRGV